jgi:hypothetical protein
LPDIPTPTTESAIEPAPGVEPEPDNRTLGFTVVPPSTTSQRQVEVLPGVYEDATEPTIYEMAQRTFEAEELRELERLQRSVDSWDPHRSGSGGNPSIPAYQRERAHDD